MSDNKDHDSDSDSDAPEEFTQEQVLYSSSTFFLIPFAVVLYLTLLLGLAETLNRFAFFLASVGFDLFQAKLEDAALRKIQRENKTRFVFSHIASLLL